MTVRTAESLHLTLPDIITLAVIVVVPAPIPVAVEEYEAVVSGVVTVATAGLDETKLTCVMTPLLVGIEAGNKADAPAAIV